MNIYRKNFFYLMLALLTVVGAILVCTTATGATVFFSTDWETELLMHVGPVKHPHVHHRLMVGLGVIGTARLPVVVGVQHWQIAGRIRIINTEQVVLLQHAIFIRILKHRNLGLSTLGFISTSRQTGTLGKVVIMFTYFLRTQQEAIQDSV
jgi:hypothetical protein